MSQRPETQYHHYIPQFLLRRFAVAPPKSRNGKYRVNAVDLTHHHPKVDTVLVKRTFGQQDMYKDSSKFTPNDQHYIEKKLGEIEQAASRIITRVVVAHAKGEVEVSLSRTDKDQLRKYLFVMKYRSPIFFKRFNHQTAEEYDSDDRATFLKYMQAKRFKKPLDVWFDNLTKVIDAPMDPDGRWIMTLRETIYPPDALWLFMMFRSMHLAFVTPSDPEEEFILTENAFSIHEGPTSYSTNRVTGKQTIKVYTEYHMLSIISPNLAVVLRNNSMPEPLEDADPEICRQKRSDLAGQMQQHTDPKYAHSLLLDLPVAKARTQHTLVYKCWMLSGDGDVESPRANDTFHFTFFQLENKHTQIINTIMLDQAHHSSAIIFKSRAALRTALEFYLDYPTQTRGGHSPRL